MLCVCLPVFVCLFAYFYGLMTSRDLGMLNRAGNYSNSTVYVCLRFDMAALLLGVKHLTFGKCFH